MTKYAYGDNEEEWYSGDFESIEDACEEAVADYDAEGETFWVGEAVPPPQPETWWDAEMWLEWSYNLDEYNMDCASDWDRSTPEQKRELDAEVRVVMAAWLDRHKLRPTFFCIQKPRKFIIVKGADGTLTYEPVEDTK